MSEVAVHKDSPMGKIVFMHMLYYKHAKDKYSFALGHEVMEGGAVYYNKEETLIMMPRKIYDALGKTIDLWVSQGIMNPIKINK